MTNEKFEDLKKKAAAFAEEERQRIVERRFTQEELDEHARRRKEADERREQAEQEILDELSPLLHKTLLSFSIEDNAIRLHFKTHTLTIGPDNEYGGFPSFGIEEI